MLTKPDKGLVISLWVVTAKLKSKHSPLIYLSKCGRFSEVSAISSLYEYDTNSLSFIQIISLIK